MSIGRVLSSSIDEEGRAKIVLALDDDDDAEVSINEGEAAKARRRLRREECAVVDTSLACVIVGAPPVRPKAALARPQNARVPKGKPMGKPLVCPPAANPFSKPVQISLDEEEEKPDRKEEKEKERKEKKEKKRRKKEEEMADGDDKLFAAASAQRMAVDGMGTMIKANNDMVTGGTAIGPLSIASLAEGSQHNKTGICMKALSNDCPMTAEQCTQKHIVDYAERGRWVAYFNQQPCKFGGQCSGARCLYEHPNRRGWNGKNTNLLVGSML